METRGAEPVVPYLKSRGWRSKASCAKLMQSIESDKILSGRALIKNLTATTPQYLNIEESSRGAALSQGR